MLMDQDTKGQHITGFVEGPALSVDENITLQSRVEHGFSTI
jgi:hypothetical protein